MTENTETGLSPVVYFRRALQNDFRQQRVSSQRLGKLEFDFGKSPGQFVAGGFEIVARMNPRRQEIRQQDYPLDAAFDTEPTAVGNRRFGQFEEGGLYEIVTLAIADLPREMLKIVVRFRPPTAVSDQEERGGLVGRNGHI